MPFWRNVLNHVLPHRTNAYRPRLLRRGWLVFFLALVLATEGFLVASLVARQSGSSFLANVIASQLVTYTNDERAENKVAALAENTFLANAAQAKAEDMAAKSYFSHQSPDGRQPWDFIKEAGYDFQYAGENLAVRFVDSKDVVDAWMQSPTHRANITKTQYREIGIGIAEGLYKGSPATYVVQYLGTPSGRILGAAVAPAQDELNALVRHLPKIVSDPRSTSMWLFAGVLALLLVLFVLAFFSHLQVQAADLLVPGAAVAMVALFFVAFNSTFLSVSSNQAAGAALYGHGTVVIDAAAAATP